MIKPLELYIGLRYTRAKRRNHFISFISLASMLGIALGVMVLITVLSVMNGFNYQIRTRFFALAPQVTILSSEKVADFWPQLGTDINKLPEVSGVSPYVSGKGMILSDGQLDGVQAVGIIPKEQKNVSDLYKSIVKGSLNSLKANKFNVVIGRKLADALGVKLGEKITLLTPTTTTSIAGVFPRYKQFTVSGIFQTTSGFGFENSVVYINISDAAKLFIGPAVTTGVHIKLHDLYHAPGVSKTLEQMLPNQFTVTNWTQQFGAFFQALAMEKTMLFIILLLIVAVAAFNLVSTLVMVVNDKRADIAILRTLGASPGMIMRAFIIQGAIVGIIGTLLGLVLGLLLAYNATEITNYIQHLFGVQFISSSVFLIDYLPSKINPKDVVEVCSLAFILSLVATIYPAFIAFRTQPAEALRYE